MTTRFLITGGAGFVGSSIALSLARDRDDAEVVAFDNLMRRGTELVLPRLAAGGVRFVHGDVRQREDLEAAGPVDVLIECSAEPSVQAGYAGGARRLIDANLLGTVNCLELARERRAALVFLSTSRVYPIAALRALPLEPAGERLALAQGATGSGWSEQGISQDFPLAGSRSLYGATKLCSELLCWEYGAIHELPVVVNRCGVIAGPWQLGRVDQGFVAHWAARHVYGGTLAYRGFGGEGLQVRDVLHVDDLCDLVAAQLADLEAAAGRLFAVGGGAERSVSLRELTALCAERSGRELEVGSDPETHPADVPWFVNDNRDACRQTGWRPRRSLEQVVEDVFRWLEEHREALRGVFA